jgi:hypothetical protein
MAEGLMDRRDHLFTPGHPHYLDTNAYWKLSPLFGATVTAM